MSNLQHAIWTLRQFNLWRRSDEDMDQPDPWEIGKAIDDAIEAMEELNEWRTLNGWGGTPEIINDFIKGQQSRIYAAQEAEEQRDRLTEAARTLPDYDAGLINDFGGGYVEWWQDYLRAEIGRANDYWRAAIAAVKGGSDERR